MQHATLSLNDDWQLTGISPDGVVEHQLSGRVPGHVHDDLCRAGIIPDPFWRDNAEQCQWVERYDWRYTREFEVAPEMLTTWMELEFAGLDTFAIITLNGVELGKTANMFIPHRFAVGQLLRAGTNTLIVYLDAHAKALVGKDLSKYWACFSNDRVYARKIQCTYGWDWVHRLVSAGIWQPVALHAYGAARVSDLFVDTVAVTHITGSAPGDTDAMVAELNIHYAVDQDSTPSHLACSAGLSDNLLTANITIHGPDGKLIVDRQHLARGRDNQCPQLLEQPRLWWPNGYGAHPLYTCTVSLQDACGETVDSETITFGIRTVAIEEIPDEAGSSIALLVNGERLFVKGANWVPADPFPGRISAEHYQRLIGLAERADMNLLRVWGGRLYEPETFWDCCNRSGVMISQDLLMACGAYPEDDPEFLRQLREEFTAAILRLRKHPALAFWCGNNELGMGDDPASDFVGKKTGMEVSGPLCAHLDPHRPYRLTSPFGGNPNNSPLAGDCHISAWYDAGFFASDMQDYRRRLETTVGRFISEYAACGAPPKHVLLKCMTEEDLADPAGAMWEYHTNNNPYSGIDVTHYRLLERTAQALFGQPDDNEQRIRQMEYAHYEYIRLAVEAVRRAKGYCNGIQFWMYNDCWPASGWSLLDYYGFAKAGYYAARRTFRPLIASIVEVEDGLQVWGCNDTLAPAAGTLRLALHPWQGGPCWEQTREFHIAANSSAVLACIPRAEIGALWQAQSVFTADLAGVRAWWYAAVPHHMRLPRARVEVSGDLTGTHGRLTLTSDSYARVVQLSADADFSDNYFDLLPGESRIIDWQSPSGAEVSVGVGWWNE